MEFNLDRFRGSLSKIKDSLTPHETSPTPEFNDFIAQLNAGFPEDHPYYGIPTGGYLNTEGTHSIDPDGSESGWYEVHHENIPTYFIYQVLKSSEGEFTIGERFGVDPRMKKTS